jgi:hypothetical protein
METWIAYSGLIPLFIGALLRYIIAARRFKRRDIAGMQRFPNFHIGALVTFLEWLGSAMGTLAILLGLLMLTLEWYNGNL